MILLTDESLLFYKLLFHLQYYVLINFEENKKYISKDEYFALSINKKIKYREKLWSNNEWIDEYVRNNPDNFDVDELKIIKKWENRVRDHFLLERSLKKYSIFISSKSKVYGVVGITEEIDEIISPNEMPVYLETVLLPFRDKIIYDGLFSRYPISFGRGLRETFKETYKKAKEKRQIILEL